MSKVISMCLWRRPAYTRQVLESLRLCVGIQDYTIYANVDAAGKHAYAQSQVIAELQRVNFCKCNISVSSKPLGCNQNTLRALTEGFCHSDYVLHLEDDVMLFPDALQYFEWARQMERDPNIFIVSLWRCRYGWLPSQNSAKPEGEDFRVGLAPELGIWGWGTWANRWEELREAWTTEQDDTKTSWDCWADCQIRGARMSLSPYISRSLNIGMEDGTHGSTQPLEYWAGAPGFGPKQPPPFTIAEHPMPDDRLMVAYSYCNKDIDIALKNFQWLEELQGSVNYPITLVVPADIICSLSAKIEQLAVDMFSDVDVIIYHGTSTTQWPTGANLAFQVTARHMLSTRYGPWLWLEPDAIPLKAGWLDILTARYAECGRVFFGPIVQEKGHMNGVGIYPADMATRCPKAMASCDTAWDAVMRPEMINNCFDAKSVIQHVWGVVGGEPHPHEGPAPSFPSQHFVERWLDPDAVLFHRCKDGTLIERLRERLHGNRNPDCKLPERQTVAGILPTLNT